MLNPFLSQTLMPVTQTVITNYFFQTSSSIFLLPYSPRLIWRRLRNVQFSPPPKPHRFFHPPNLTFYIFKLPVLTFSAFLALHLKNEVAMHTSSLFLSATMAAEESQNDWRHNRMPQSGSGK
ncbi:hypothetical protein ACOMHN_027848 [Nucella lapillus]